MGTTDTITYRVTIHPTTNKVNVMSFDLDAIDASVENEMFFLDNATEAEYTRHSEFIQNSCP